MSRLLMTIGLALAVVLTLSACREEERGRSLTFQKGTYMGKPDTPLSAETERALRGRARTHMGADPGLGGTGGGGAAPAPAPAEGAGTGSTVRPPAASAVDERELRSRAGSQRF